MLINIINDNFFYFEYVDFSLYLNCCNYDYIFKHDIKYLATSVTKMIIELNLYQKTYVLSLRKFLSDYGYNTYEYRSYKFDKILKF
jgi:hypothetical protein